jgi:hypothetical protein
LNCWSVVIAGLVFGGEAGNLDLEGRRETEKAASPKCG